jgi:hypothetical protein
MANSKQPRILSVEAIAPAQLRVCWVDGGCAEIDLVEPIHRLKALAPLQDWKFFKQAAVGEWGWAIVWNEDVDLGVDSLWRMALEQAGEAMPTKNFRTWREGNRLSLTAAARALGLSRRMVAYYDSGERLIPKTILLATAGFDALKGNRAA